MDVSEALLRRLARSRERHLVRGDHLFRQGDNVESICLVRHGRIKLIRHTPDGHESILQVAMPGDLVAEASLFSEVYHCSAVVESAAAELCSFDKRSLIRALAEDAGAAMEVAELFARRIRRLRALMEIRNIRSARDRIYSYLELNADAARRVHLHLCLKDMAHELGLAHETFYRNLKLLEQEGRIIRKVEQIRLR